MLRLVFILSLMFAGVAQSQWLDGGRKQAAAQSSNGALYIHDGVMYFFNYEQYMQKSTNNGLAWIDLLDSGLGAQGPGLSRAMDKMSYASGRLYGSFNYGNTGMPVYSTDGGDHWLADTSGGPSDGLGGYPTILDIEAWGNWLYVHWNGTQIFTVKTIGGSFLKNDYMSGAGHTAGPVVSHGDTLFVLSGTGLYYTIDGGNNFITPSNTGFLGNLPKQLILDGSRLYATMHQTGAVKNYTLLYSDDQGNHWNQIDISGATTQKQLNGSTVSPIAAFIKGDRIEFSFEQTQYNTAPNVWMSNDLGKTWNADTVGLPNNYAEGVTHFAYTPDGYLWAVRGHENIYKQKIDAGIAQGGVQTERDLALAVFPNPAMTELTIGGKTGRGTFELADMLGRSIMHGEISLEYLKLNVSGLPRGCYWLSVRDESGRSTRVPISLR